MTDYIVTWTITLKDLNSPELAAIHTREIQLNPYSPQTHFVITNTDTATTTELDLSATPYPKDLLDLTYYHTDAHLLSDKTTFITKLISAMKTDPRITLMGYITYLIKTNNSTYKQSLEDIYDDLFSQFIDSIESELFRSIDNQLKTETQHTSEHTERLFKIKKANAFSEYRVFKKNHPDLSPHNQSAYFCKKYFEKLSY
ncbi:hypothetical protein [Bacteroides sp.]|uniref:hypothetical protein n=1 Tax=Bacteroides sp. TaxID=29523 RepID=UPI00260E6A57|nr:hypothetical protein [Bacteroides sp.]MDD3039069.1 hypothetical protein [Bacteroides sp.]